MPTPDPKSYADQWVRAWNAHDIEAVLDHFADDVVFTSPVAARVVPESEGVVRGKAALRDYWTAALKTCRTCTSTSSVCTAASHVGDQLPQPSWRPGQRGADLQRRRPGARRPRHVSV